jgi:ribosomal protein S18 acetylase RimI-like enzyme
MNIDNILLRHQKSEDSPQIANIILSSFSSKFQPLTNLSKQQLIHYLIDTGFTNSEENSNTWVAEKNNEVIGVLSLKCANNKDNKKRKNKSFFQLVKKYGLWNNLKLLFAFSLLNSPLKKNTCYIEHIAVDESARGKGVGKLLMNKAKEVTFNDSDNLYLSLHVAEDNEGAVRLYKNLGFQVIYKATSLLTSLMFKQKTWLFMMMSKNGETIIKSRTKNNWWLGFFGFIGLIYIQDIIAVFNQEASIFNLLYCFWFLWFLYFIPNSK